MRIFDSQGATGQIPPKTEFLVTFWTENDGGPHFRPTAKATLSKASLKRPLVTQEGYSGFVLHGNLKTTEPTHAFSALGKQEYSTDGLILEGDFNADGKPDARVISRDFIDALYHILETQHSSEEVVDGGP